jgi:hypothetical protein
MRKNVMKLFMAALLIVAAVPFVNAQVQVGDILCEGDRVVSLSDYDSANDAAIGVVFYVDESGEHGWAVSLDNVGQCSWGNYEEDTKLDNVTSNFRAARDMDGYEHTKTILEENPDYPAFTIVDFENGWYLPAVGQMKRLYDNFDEVNKTLEKVGGTIFERNGYTYWSSTEHDSDDAWYMCSIGGFGNTSDSFNDCKTSSRYVRSVRDF